jgi:uncharacterized protein involved in response to NO
MIPWFTSRVVSNYVLIRPYSLLWALWTGCLLHFLLTAVGLWRLDLARGFFAGSAGVLVLLTLGFAAAGSRRVCWLYCMLHFYGRDSHSRCMAWIVWRIFLGWVGRPDWRRCMPLGIGFFGAMLIGMASRVSLGHSGRALQADTATWWLFWLIQGVALLRMLPDLFPESIPNRLISLAGLLWLIVLAGWAWKYAPMTWRARVDAKPG